MCVCIKGLFVVDYTEISFNLSFVKSIALDNLHLYVPIHKFNYLIMIVLIIY
jgi:hypothetical protein